MRVRACVCLWQLLTTTFQKHRCQNQYAPHKRSRSSFSSMTSGARFLQFLISIFDSLTIFTINLLHIFLLYRYHHREVCGNCQLPRHQLARRRQTLPHPIRLCDLGCLQRRCACCGWLHQLQAGQEAEASIAMVMRHNAPGGSEQRVRVRMQSGMGNGPSL